MAFGVSGNAKQPTIARMLVVGFLLALVVGVLNGGAINVASADDFDPSKFNPAQFEEYERQLNAILRTHREEEKAFISKIVEKVRSGKLPSKLIETSFKWVKTKRPNTSYPFIYFEKVLRLQAAKIKLQDEVPTFDYSIYRSAGQRASGQVSSAGQRSQAQTATAPRSAAGNSAGQKR